MRAAEEAVIGVTRIIAEDSVAMQLAELPSAHEAARMATIQAEHAASKDQEQGADNDHSMQPTEELQRIKTLPLVIAAAADAGSPLRLKACLLAASAEQAGTLRSMSASCDDSAESVPPQMLWVRALNLAETRCMHAFTVPSEWWLQGVFCRGSPKHHEL